MSPRLRFLSSGLLFVSSLLVLNPARAQGQAQPRVVEAVDNARRVTLAGNVHPLARAEFDRGAASESLPMTRMLMLLKRSDEQESALQDYLEKQQDKGSPNYHQWLTPQEFGVQYGPADADIQSVTQWLSGQGFTVEKVYSGKTVIEFSGSAAQVRAAFGTEIRQYQVEGKTYTANASDPQIPAALAPVVAGVVSLNSFPRQTMYRAVGVFTRSKETGKAKLTQPENPEFTYQCGINSNTGQAIYCNAVVPYDFATIYNVLPLWNATPAIDGTGQTIAIVAESNISLDDVHNFRSSFGLPANDPVIVLNGLDPGLVPGPETEADLDVEWSGAVAKGATIKLVVSQSTETSSGVDLSAVYTVDNNLAPVMSMSFGNCELYLGTAGNQFFNNLWEQAAAQGISVFVASGDNGSAGCDFNRGTEPQPANNGLQVSGIASTPFNIAVGGTDFNDIFSESPYWSITNDPATQKSALRYIPETTWNDSCTNAVFGDPRIGFSTNPETNCNNSQLVNWVFTIGGSGGQSNCTTPSGQTPASCAGGYAKPSWQTGVGVPLNGGRAVPDVSLFSGDGFTGTAYAVCEADRAFGTCTSSFLTVGGTSASSPAFAGIMALVNQKTQSRQGSANVVFYKLAAKQTPANCNSSTGPASTCVFNDVTSGTIAMPCTKGSLNCTTSSSKDQYGILSGYSAGAGYDLATGLGSVNAQNLVNNWSSITFLPSTTTLSATVNGSPVSSISVAHGATVGVTSDVSAGSGATGTPTGQVALMATPNPTPANPSGPLSASLGIQALALSSGAASSTSVILPGGSYNLTAHYQGDAAFGSSDSSPIAVSITAETSKTLMSIPTFDPTSGRETGNNPTSIVYGSPYIARIDVGNAQATLSYPPKPVCTPPSCPTGTVAWTDAINGGAATPLDSGTFALNSEGFTEDQTIQLSGGSHVLTATYSGDNSFKSSVGSYSLTVAPAPTSITEQVLVANPTEGVTFGVSITGGTQTQSGVAPTGTITFSDGATQLGSPVPVTGGAGQNGSAPWFSVNQTDVTIATAGSHTLSAQYSGDSNYAASTTSAPVNVLHGAAASISFSPSTVNYGSTVTITGIIDTSVPMSNTALKPTGTVSLYGSADGQITSGVSTTIADASGNWEIHLTATITPSNSEGFNIIYSGDSNYGVVSATSAFLTVVLPDFSLTPNPGALTITAGQTGSMTVTIAPTTSLSSTVTLSCAAPVMIGITCSVSPASVNLSNNNSATTTVSFATIGPSNATTAAVRQKHSALIWPFWMSGGRLCLGCIGIATLLMLLIPSRRRHHRVAFGAAATCLVVWALGCGGGSGGGGGGLVPTSVAITASATKVPAGISSIALTAKVSSSKTVTGTITFWENGSDGALTPPLNIVGGAVTAQVALPLVGTHQIYAQYSGDSQNQGSQSSTVNVVATGTSYAQVSGETGPVSHYSTVWLTIQ